MPEGTVQSFWYHKSDYTDKREWAQDNVPYDGLEADLNKGRKNPIKAGLSKSPAGYPWSSYGSIGKKSSQVEDSKVLELLPEDKQRAFLEESYEQVFLDAESESSLNDREVIELIKRTCKLESTTNFVLLPPER